MRIYSFSWLCLATCFALLSARFAAAQTKPTLGGAAVLPSPGGLPAAVRVTTADTSLFRVGYCTALPTLDPKRWEKDYTLYEHWLTPEIRRTQMGLNYPLAGGGNMWWCQNSASPHAQLDTATMVWDPQRLVGGWRSVATRVITHTDSFSIADQKFFRSAVAHDVPGDIRLTLTDRKLSTFVDALRPKQVSKNYVLINRRYMLIYGLLRSGASVSLVGFDPVGRFLMHTCSVTERGVKGRYLTYETVVQQLIFEREK